jgi:hypothetical protein
MPCIGFLGVQFYHVDLPKDLFNMIYKNQNFLIGELNMDLFSHLELSFYNKFQGRRAYRNSKLPIYTVLYKDIELFFYLEKSTEGCIYFIDKAVNSHSCIECNNTNIDIFNEFVEELKNIGLTGFVSSGFFVIEE